jgi:hypothetical protein
MIEMENNKKKVNWFVELLKFGIVPFVVLGMETKKRTGSTIKAIAMGAACWLIAGVAWGMFLGSDDNSEQIFILNNEILEAEKVISIREKEIEKLKQNKPEKVEVEKIKETPKPAKNKKVTEYTFTSGNYIAGDDFEPGKYDIIAIKGNSGNVSSDNMFSGGINAVMGTGDFGDKEYKNISLPKDSTLSVSSLTIKLVKK